MGRPLICRLLTNYLKVLPLRDVRLRLGDLTIEGGTIWTTEALTARRCRRVDVRAEEENEKEAIDRPASVGHDKTTLKSKTAAIRSGGDGN